MGSDFDVDAAAARHQRYDSIDACRLCRVPWPCDAAQALDELRFTRHLLGLAQRALRSRDDVEMNTVLAQIFCAVGEVGTSGAERET